MITKYVNELPNYDNVDWVIIVTLPITDNYLAVNISFMENVVPTEGRDGLKDFIIIVELYMQYRPYTLWLNVYVNTYLRIHT